MSKKILQLSFFFYFKQIGLTFSVLNYKREHKKLKTNIFDNFISIKFIGLFRQLSRVTIFWYFQNGNLSYLQVDVHGHTDHNNNK